MLTEKQKEAIMIINRLKSKQLEDEEYFLLLDFIVGEKETKTTWLPYTPAIEPVITTPYWTKMPPYEVTCTQNSNGKE